MIRSITPIFSILISVLIFFFVIQPKYDEVKALRVETEEYAVATAQYTAFNARVQQLLLERDSIKSTDRNRLDLLIPEVLNDTRVLVDIEAIASQSGVFITGIETTNDNVDAASLVSKNVANSIAGEAQQGDDLPTSDITFDLIGEYDAFKNFLRGIETSLTIMHVVKISFSRSEGDFNIFSVTVRTYALPDSQNNN